MRQNTGKPNTAAETNVPASTAWRESTCMPSRLPPTGDSAPPGAAARASIGLSGVACLLRVQRFHQVVGLFCNLFRIHVAALFGIAAFCGAGGPCGLDAGGACSFARLGRASDHRAIGRIPFRSRSAALRFIIRREKLPQPRHGTHPRAKRLAHQHNGHDHQSKQHNRVQHEFLRTEQRLERAQRADGRNLAIPSADGVLVPTWNARPTSTNATTASATALRAAEKRARFFATGWTPGLSEGRKGSAPDSRGDKRRVARFGTSAPIPLQEASPLSATDASGAMTCIVSSSTASSRLASSWSNAISHRSFLRWFLGQFP